MLLFLSVTSSFAQENQTFFKRNKSANENSFDGALYIEVSPIIEASIINKEWGINLGGKGAVIVNQKWAVGGIGKGLVSENSFLGDNLDGEKEKDTRLNLNYGAGGLFVEYYLGLDRAFHLSFPLHVMAGGISLKDEQKNTTIESSALMIVEPGMNIEFNVAQNFMPALHLSYRQVLANDLANLTNGDISGLNLGLIIKFGHFK